MVAGICAYHGGGYFDYGITLSRISVIMQDARPEIGDNLWTLIFRMGQ
jgi:hypothetical protein